MANGFFGRESEIAEVRGCGTGLRDFARLGGLELRAPRLLVWNGLRLQVC